MKEQKKCQVFLEEKFNKIIAILEHFNFEFLKHVLQETKVSELSAWTITKLKLFQINSGIQIAIMWSHQQSKFIIIELKHEDVNFLWRCQEFMWNNRECFKHLL